MPWTTHLTALPDCVWDLVLQALYDTFPSDGFSTEHAFRGIASLAISCRSLRDTVRRVRTQASYCLAAGPGAAEGVQSCAEHLNNHAACTSVCMHLAAKQDMPLPDFPEVAPFQQRISHAASHRLAHLMLSCAVEGQPDDQPSLPGPAVLALAGALPGLRMLSVHACTSGTSELFFGMAARCPQLRKLELTLPAFSTEAVSSLSALSGLTSLDLRERHQDPHQAEGPPEATVYPAALLLELAALTALTHLGLRFGPWRSKEVRFIPFHIVVPAISHLPLRSLVLTAPYCSLDVADFPRLAASLPSLEQLVCPRMSAYYLDKLDARKPVTWHMPNLRVITVTTLDCFSSSLDADNALHLAAGCPALQRLEGVKVALTSRDGRQPGSSAPAAAKSTYEMCRLAQGLGVLAARGIVDRMEVSASSSAEVEALCTALLELQPAEHRTALAGCIRMLQVWNTAEPAPVGRLVELLPFVHAAFVHPSALPALAPLQSLTTVACVYDRQRAMFMGEAPREELRAFAQRRAEALGPDGAARAVEVCWLQPRADGSEGVKCVRVQSGVVHSLDD